MSTTGWFQYNGNDIEACSALRYTLTYDTTGAFGGRAGEAHQVIAGGSAVNGPAQGSFGKTISIFKEGFGTTAAKGGEIDGLYVVLRQDGRDGVRADGCSILIDAGFYDNSGFVGGIEGATRKFSKATNQVVNQFSYQIGCMDHDTSTEIGYYLTALIGEISHGIRLDALNAGAFFSNYCTFNYGDYTVFNIDWRGQVRFGNPENRAAMFQRVQPSGTMEWVNSNETARLAWLDQGGSLGVRTSIDLTPQGSPPAPKQGRIYFDPNGGRLGICRDGVNWSYV